MAAPWPPPPVTIATLTLMFGGLALVLAAVGLYGVTAYTVEQAQRNWRADGAGGGPEQRGEDGAEGSVLAGWGGIGCGDSGGDWSGKLIADQLFGVKAWDPVMLGGATLLLGAAALIAAMIPAQRAAGSGSGGGVEGE